MSVYKLVFICGFFAYSFNLVAEDNTELNARLRLTQKLSSIWSSDAELGYVKTTGNTTTEALNFKFSLNNKRNNWEHGLKLASTKNSDSTGITAKRYLISMKSQYDFTRTSYLFGKILYEDDRFSGYKYQASEVVGYGRKLISNNHFKLNAEAGLGVRQNKFESGLSETENVYLLASDLDWRISKTASLSESLTIEVGDTRTISKSVTALTTQIHNSLSSKISYTVKTASEVPAGTRKTDTQLAVTLVYAFK